MCVQRIGLAKIPKTLALEVDPADPNSEGMLMLNVLLDPNRRRANTDQQRYDEALGFLWDNTTNLPKVAYLVVQKLFGGEQLTRKRNLEDKLERWFLQEKLAIGHFSVLNEPSLSSHFTQTQAMALLDNLRKGDILQSAPSSRFYSLSNNFNRNVALPTTLTHTRGKAAEVKTLLNTMISVFSDQTKVRNMGRVLAADSLIGNADRIEEGSAGANWGNLFVNHKQNRGNQKVDYSIRAIDNDTIMQTYPHRAFKDTNGYLTALLRGGSELGVSTLTAAPTSNLQKLLTNFDTWFNDYVVMSLVSDDPDYQPIVAQYTNAGFPPDATQGNWPQVLRWFKDGLVSGLQRINNIDIAEMRRMHSSLVLMYGVDANFDFLAFQIRHTYLCAAQINRSNPQPFTINHDAIRNQLRVSVDQAQGTFDAVIPDLQEALNFGMGVNPPLLTPQEQQDILQLLVHLSMAEQRNLVPTIPKPGPNQEATRRRKLACMCKILQLFLIQYISDLDRDASSRFVDVSGTSAYRFACRNIKYVEESRIYQRHAPYTGAENALGEFVITKLYGLDPNIYWVS